MPSRRPEFAEEWVRDVALDPLMGAVRTGAEKTRGHSGPATTTTNARFENRDIALDLAVPERSMWYYRSIEARLKGS
jgi:hypothetical protein